MLKPWGTFFKAPGSYQAHCAVLFAIPDKSFKSFENCIVKLSAKETKGTSLEVRPHPAFLETSTYDFGPVKFEKRVRGGVQLNSPNVT